MRYLLDATRDMPEVGEVCQPSTARRFASHCDACSLRSV